MPAPSNFVRQLLDGAGLAGRLHTCDSKPESRSRRAHIWAPGSDGRVSQGSAGHGDWRHDCDETRTINSPLPDAGAPGIPDRSDCPMVRLGVY